METRGNLEKLSEGKVHILTRSATIFTIEEFVHMQNTLFDANTTLEATEADMQPNEDDDEDDIKKKEDFNALLGGTVDAAWA